MYLNRFADGLEPLDLAATDEFQSLLSSASDLSIPYRLPVRYVSRNVVLNGLRFHLLEWGEPASPPLVLLHGGNQTAHSWDLVSLYYSQAYHIIALDQRGHGDSEWPRDSHASPPEMADDIARLLPMLGISHPVIIGHSMGGIVAMTLLRDNPGIASKAVFVDVGPELSPEGTDVIQDFIRQIGEFSSLDDFISRVVAYDPFRSPEHIARTARYNLLRRADGVFLSKHDQRRRLLRTVSAEFMRSRPTLEDMRNLQVPTLVVRGSESRVLTSALADEFVAVLPQGTLVTVPNCAHNVHSQNTLGFLQAVDPFLSR